jgi:hypothetical protein
MSAAVLLVGAGGMLAVAAHVGCRLAERRARESYRELVGEGYDAPADRWDEIRPLAGGWGCLVAGLELARGVGVAVAGGAALYLVVGGR